MASTASSTSSWVRPNKLASLRTTTLAERRQGHKMPPVASTTSPAFSQLQVGLNRKLENRLCMQRSSSRACAILSALPQFLSISVSDGISLHAAQFAFMCSSSTSCTDAPERQMHIHSMHEYTTLPASSATPILVKQCCRLRAFISHSRADSGRSCVS